MMQVMRKFNLFELQSSVELIHSVLTGKSSDGVEHEARQY
jgi:hypothetical protein